MQAGAIAVSLRPCYSGLASHGDSLKFPGRSDHLCLWHRVDGFAPANSGAPAVHVLALSNRVDDTDVHR
eukprot:6313604-Amphidinium_carterae.1